MNFPTLPSYFENAAISRQYGNKMHGIVGYRVQIDDQDSSPPSMYTMTKTIFDVFFIYFS